KMVASANYTGIAMFEFKTNPKEGDWILLEINARPWGSLPLPVALGIDFPYRLYLLLVKDNETAPVAYKNEVYGRNLISDLWQVRTIMQVWSHTPRKLFLFLIQWFFEFRLLFLGREHHDVGVSDDRKPGILELRNFAGVFWESLRSKVFGEKPMKSGLRKKLIDIDRENTSASHILFICEGNICRSPYAEKKLQQLFTDEAQRYTILSAGMLPRNRRASPPVALEVAAQRGVSLTHHLSRHASEDLVKDAAIIILFDRTNLKSFLARYPSFENKVFFLGELRESVGKIVEIQDPFGKDAQTFNTTYEQIDECLNCFTEIIKKRPN
ncbi:MAG: arsenate reductase/protein-tyrosine-phosphatase family protein, partial [Burkholderiaceae bacterium]